MVSLVRGVGCRVGQHGVDGGGERFEAHEAGEDSFVADGVGQDERGALAELVREKLRGAGIDAGADGRGLGGGAEFFDGQFSPASFGRDGDLNIL